MSTAREIRPFRVPDTALLVSRSGFGKVDLIPRKDAPPDPSAVRHVPFQEWWTEPVYGRAGGELLSREKLVCSLRDQDGGAHVDDFLTERAYVALRNDDISITVIAGGVAKKLDAHLASMRQIAWELHMTLADVMAITSPAPAPAADSRS